MCTEFRSDLEGGGEVAGSTEMLNIPSPIPEVDEVSREEYTAVCVCVCVYVCVMCVCTCVCVCVCVCVWCVRACVWCVYVCVWVGACE